MNKSKVIKISEKDVPKAVPQQQTKGNHENHNDKFCVEHPISSHKIHIGFCYTCAENGIANHLLTFCRFCNKDKNKEHAAHK